MQGVRESKKRSGGQTRSEDDDRHGVGGGDGVGEAGSCLSNDA